MIMPRAAEPAAPARQPLVHRLHAHRGADDRHGARWAASPPCPTCWPSCWCSGACTSRRRIGVLWAFVFGLLIDVHDGALLGQHALAYSGLCFGAITLHRRLHVVQRSAPRPSRCCRCSSPRMCWRWWCGMIVGGMWPGWGGAAGAGVRGGAVAASPACCCWPRSAALRTATHIDLCRNGAPTLTSFAAPQGGVPRPPVGRAGAVMVVLKNLHQELSRFRLRVLAAGAFVLFCFGLLVAAPGVVAGVRSTTALPSGPSPTASPSCPSCRIAASSRTATASCWPATTRPTRWRSTPTRSPDLDATIEAL